MSYFSTDYHEARDKFLAASENYGLRNIRFRLPHEAISDLFIDFAFVKRNPRKLLIHLSGTHGVEGFVGSAVQRAILADPAPATDASLLFVHALNPYGMQYFRRANGNNVDLNRNYTRAPQPNPDYRHFRAYLNPQTRMQFFTGKLSAFYYAKKFGPARTSQAVASGQNEFPPGLFYMGDGIQREILLFQEILRSHFGGAEEALVIDVHSGLGEWRGEMLFADEDVDPEAQSLFPPIFGRALTRPDPSAGSYINQGRLSGAIRAALPRAKVHTILQELGTYSPGKVLAALRLENFEWHANGPARGASPAAQRQMFEAFCPADPDWRENALRLGKTRWFQAAAYFARESSTSAST